MASTISARICNVCDLIIPDPQYGDMKLSVSWCLYGAMIKVYGRGEEFNIAKSRIIKAHANDHIIEFNDTPGRTQQEVVDLCIKAGV